MKLRAKRFFSFFHRFFYTFFLVFFILSVNIVFFSFFHFPQLKSKSEKKLHFLALFFTKKITFFFVYGRNWKKKAFVQLCVFFVFALKLGGVYYWTPCTDICITNIKNGIKYSKTYSSIVENFQDYQESSF